MTQLLSESDRIFQLQFEGCKFPVAEFDHRAHLRIAYVYLSQHDTETACRLVRDALQNFLDYNGVDPSKFHETLTRAWILASRHFMEKTAGSDSADQFIDLNPEMLDTKIMTSHYSTQLLFSDKARKSFVSADLSPIPLY